MDVPLRAEKQTQRDVRERVRSSGESKAGAVAAQTPPQFYCVNVTLEATPEHMIVARR